MGLSKKSTCLRGLKAWKLRMKASFWGLFKTNVCWLFRKQFLFTKFEFSKFWEKVFLNYT